MGSFLCSELYLFLVLLGEFHFPLTVDVILFSLGFYHPGIGLLNIPLMMHSTFSYLGVRILTYCVLYVDCLWALVLGEFYPAFFGGKSNFLFGI